MQREKRHWQSARYTREQTTTQISQISKIPKTLLSLSLSQNTLSGWSRRGLESLEMPQAVHADPALWRALVFFASKYGSWFFRNTFFFFSFFGWFSLCLLYVKAPIYEMIEFWSTPTIMIPKKKRIPITRGEFWGDKAQSFAEAEISNSWYVKLLRYLFWELKKRFYIAVKWLENSLL